MCGSSLKSVFLSLFFTTSLAQAGAQKTSVIPLVPAVNWRLASSQTGGLDVIRKYAGDPVIEREYGVQTIEVRSYQWEGALAEIIVEKAPDASAAYGLLTYYRTRAMIPEKGMRLTVSGPEVAFMVRGRYFIRVLRPNLARVSDAVFRALLNSVAEGVSPKDAESVSLPLALPTNGLIPGTQKYVVGPEAARRLLPSFRTDLIGFARGAELQMGDYAAGRVLAISYPTPQISRLQYGLMEKLLDVNQERGSASIRGRREGSFVFLVLNADSTAAANKLLDKFKVSNSVSWDKPYPGRKAFTQQMFELILANVLFTLLLMGSAVVSGILIVVFRRSMGKFFPDSFWGRQEEGGIITLRLNL